MEWTVILFMTVVGLGNTIDRHQDQIDALESRLDQVESIQLKQAGAHASFYAGQQLTNNELREAIEDAVKMVAGHDHK